MKTRIIRIGNSPFIRLPRALLEQAGLGEHVVLRATPGRIVIDAARTPRAGWAEAARAIGAAGDDALLNTETGTHFDREEWEWV